VYCIKTERRVKKQPHLSGDTHVVSLIDIDFIFKKIERIIRNKHIELISGIVFNRPVVVV
jgi:hypothetical protein